MGFIRRVIKMAFKDCVNTKDCAKMQADIDDVKDSISGITDNVETISETTIPAIEDEIATITETTIPDIQDDISDLDDRVEALENSGGSDKNWTIFTGTDWSEFSTDGLTNQDILLEFFVFPHLLDSNNHTINCKMAHFYQLIPKGSGFSNSSIPTGNNIVIPIYYDDLSNNKFAVGFATLGLSMSGNPLTGAYLHSYFACKGMVNDNNTLVNTTVQDYVNIIKTNAISIMSDSVKLYYKA